MTSPHLSDDRLVEVCILDASSPDERQHLESCTKCDARRVRLQRLLDDVAGVASAQADEVFSAERLARQQARILTQLQQDGRPARVIAFPAGHVQEAPAVRTRPSTRWVAAAAVAGLVIGVIAGRMGFNYSLLRPSTPRIAVTQAPGLRPAGNGGIREVSATISDEEFLSQLERASTGPVAALEPLDELTPLPWEVR